MLATQGIRTAHVAELAEYAVVLSVIALPLTYVAILLVANDARPWASKPTDGSPASSAAPASPRSAS
jgi:hypothetical protein